MDYYSIIVWVVFLVFIVGVPIQGEPEKLGLLMVYCRKSRYFRWLTWEIGGKEISRYLDEIEQRINGRRCL